MSARGGGGHSSDDVKVKIRLRSVPFALRIGQTKLAVQSHTGIAHMSNALKGHQDAAFRVDRKPPKATAYQSKTRITQSIQTSGDPP